MKLDGYKLEVILTRSEGKSISVACELDKEPEFFDEKEFIYSMDARVMKPILSAMYRKEFIDKVLSDERIKCDICQKMFDRENMVLLDNPKCAFCKECNERLDSKKDPKS